MASTNVALSVRGVDKTGGVFKSIARNAKAIFAGIAFGAVGVSIAKTVKELGQLSDIAMRASTTADSITKVSNALANLGINGVAPAEIAQSFQYMARATGRTGMEGFTKTIEDIAQLPDIAQRSQAAMATFGRGGMRYMALIEDAAKNGISAFQEFADIQPYISDKAASAGDKVADAWSTCGEGLKSVWSEVVGSISDNFDKKFTGGVRQAAYVAYGHFRAFVQRLMVIFDNLGEYLTVRFKGIGNSIILTLKAVFVFWGKSVASVFTGDSIHDLAYEAYDTLQEAWESFNAVPEGVQEKFDAIDQELEGYLGKVQKYFEKNRGELSGMKGGLGGGATETGGQTFRSSADIANKWISGGSYEAATFAMRAQMRRDDPQTKELKGIRGIMQQMLKNQENQQEVAVMDFAG